jgi:hypothetical protein
LSRSLSPTDFSGGKSLPHRETRPRKAAPVDFQADSDIDESDGEPTNKKSLLKPRVKRPRKNGPVSYFQADAEIDGSDGEPTKKRRRHTDWDDEDSEDDAYDVEEEDTDDDGDEDTDENGRGYEIEKVYRNAKKKDDDDDEFCLGKPRRSIVKPRRTGK